jgi:hypothetical protein
VPAFFVASSALVKRYVIEPGSAWVATLLDRGAGNQIYLARISGVEVVSAITRRARSGSLTPASAAIALTQFYSEFAGRFLLVPLTARVLHRAMNLAETQALRGYDAVQLTAALHVEAQRIKRRRRSLTFVSADAALNGAASAEGLPIDDLNAHP